MLAEWWFEKRELTWGGGCGSLCHGSLLPSRLPHQLDSARFLSFFLQEVIRHILNPACAPRPVQCEQNVVSCAWLGVGCKCSGVAHGARHARIFVQFMQLMCLRCISLQIFTFDVDVILVPITIWIGNAERRLVSCCAPPHSSCHHQLRCHPASGL